MATHIVPDQELIDNLPPTLRQAITAAQVLQPQVNGRYAAAVHLVATGGARLNTDGSVDVISRSGGPRHRLNGASCDCKDAQYNAPEIAGRRACAHQIAAWILRKAARLGSTSSPSSEPVELGSVQPPTSNFHFTQTQLLTAASRLAGDVAYEITTTHIGGHGDANILQATARWHTPPTWSAGTGTMTSSSSPTGAGAGARSTSRPCGSWLPPWPRRRRPARPWITVSSPRPWPTTWKPAPTA